MSTRIFLLLLPALLLFAGMFLAWKCADRLGTRSCIAFFIVRTALLFFALPYLSSPIPPDIRVWASHAEWMVDEGLFPDIGFPTAYQLGFNLLLFIAYEVWHHPYSIMAVFNLFDLASVPFMYLAFRELFDVKTAKRIVILYLTSPCSWICAFFGQDEPVVCCFAMAALWMLAKNRLAVAAVHAFLGFFFTKAFAPVYLGLFFLRSRWKGVAFVVLGIVIYCGISVGLGIDPFDFRSASALDEVATASIADNGFVRGSVWYYLQQVPSLVQYGALLAASVVTGLMFVKTLWDEGIEANERLRATLVLTALFAFWFFAFFRLCYEPYMLPFLPVMIAAFLMLEYTPRTRAMLLAAFLGWALFFMRKDPQGHSFLTSMGYALDAVVYVGYLVFPTVLIHGYRRNLISPFAGLKLLPRVLGSGYRD